MNELKTIIAYIKTKARRIALAAFMLALFMFIISLYRLPLNAVLYASQVSVLFLTVFAVIGYILFRKKYLRLKKLNDTGLISHEQLPPPTGEIEQAYAALIERMLRDQDAAKREAAEKLARNASYYATWAHQVKTPIAAMRLMLQSGAAPDSGAMREELISVERYVDMAMAYVRLDDSGDDFVIREYDLDEILKPILRRFSRVFIRKKLKLNYETLSVRTLTDKKWLSFMLEQLLSNAVKYTTDGSVSIYLENGSLVIADTGIGISPSDMPRIYEMGYTGLNGRIDEHASGIGLYLCRRIADMLGHRLTIESQLNVGTRAIVSLARDHVYSE